MRYVIPDGQLAAGSTLGAPKGTLVLNPNGGVETFFSVDLGLALVRGLQVGFWDGETRIALARHSGQIAIYPERQEHAYGMSNGLHVTERVLMLSRAPRGDAVDPAAAYFALEIENPTGRPLSTTLRAIADLRGTTEPNVRVAYDPALHAFLAWNTGDPRSARAFRTRSRPTGFELTTDHGAFTRYVVEESLRNRVDARGCERLALFEHAVRLKPGESRRVEFTLAATTAGTAALRRILRALPPYGRAAEGTRRYYAAQLAKSVVVTPDSEVNAGVAWAKANMLRTMSYSPTGWAFTNDPTRSSNSVARDTAWFAIGCNYLAPWYARAILTRYIDHLERFGKAIEYYDIRTGVGDDYGLNINDDTPLLLLALWHHYRATRDDAFLARIYGGARRAANYILSQRDARGLIFCTAEGVADWGICGWRNVIENYRLSGATTEVNAECFAALDRVARMAERLNRRADARRFRAAATALRDAINTHLLDPNTGVYYLALDVDGVARTDVTCDLVFPVMFGVAERETAAAVVSRLSVPAFWTSAGIRTVPRNDVNYRPSEQYGLLGGVWTGVSFWYAFAAAEFNPDFMAAALHNSFHAYSCDPQHRNTVPGQFSEWLNGETLANRGMMLSPWLPPRYLWAALEGPAGLDLSDERPRLRPRLAPDWRWLCARDVPYGDAALSWFVVRLPQMTVYANVVAEGVDASRVYTRDATDALLVSPGEEVCVAALQRGRQLVLFAGNIVDRTIWISLPLRRLNAGTYRARIYNTLRGEWIERAYERDELTAGIPFEIDRFGFCVVEIEPLR